MRKRALHVFLALGLVLGVLGGTLMTGSAQEDPPEIGEIQVYFPWVPNGAVIDDPRDFGTTGPYYGSITIQNLENSETSVHYNVLATGDGGSFSLDAYASLTLSAADLFNDNGDTGNGTGNEDGPDGSAVVFWTEGGAQIAGVQKQSAPEGPDENARTSDDHEIVSGYTGLTPGQVGSTAVLPIVQTNSNWNTLIRVTNFDDGEANISVQLRSSGAAPVWTTTLSENDVASGETVTFDLVEALDEEEVSPEWVGSAIITSAGDVAAVAERVKNQTNMMIMNVSRISPDIGAEQYAPLVFNNWNFWNTGISVANLMDSPNNVTITYFDPDGNEAGDADNFTLPALGMDFIYTPALNDEEEEFVGSAIIEADGPFVGSVDEVKYFGDDPDTGHAMSYMVEDQPAWAGESLAVPLIQKGTVVAGIAHGDTSGIHVFNPTESFVVAAITYFDQDGDEVFTDVELLEANEGYTSYTVNLPQLGDDFDGSAIVQPLFGEGAVVAASNNVNYDVQFDGSASFTPVHIAAPGPALDINIDLDPPESENIFYEGEALVWLQAEIAHNVALEEGFLTPGATVEAGFDYLMGLYTNGIPFGNFEAALDAQVTAEVITPDQRALIWTAYLAAGINQHQITATVTINEVPVQAGVIDVVVEDDDPAVVDPVFEGQFDIVDGVATITYPGGGIRTETITATFWGEETTATKTWIEPDDNGGNGNG